MITSDIKGIVKFWKINDKYNYTELNLIGTLNVPNKDKTYILLINNILFAVADKLYIYDINNYIYINSNSLNIKTLCWNSMAVINEKEQIVVVGCQGCTYIIKINSINDKYLSLKN